MPADGSVRARFVTDELVVAIPHQNLVLDELADLVRGARLDRSNANLGLSVISVSHEGADDGPALDRLLAAVRERCRVRYDGWTPTIGKNRLLQRIDGVGGYIGGGGGIGGAGGYIGGGGGGLPTAVDASAVPTPPAGERGRDVRVALLDTRLYAHPDLAGRYYAEDVGALLPIAPTLPYHAGHATFVAGLVAQRAPHVELEILNVLSDELAAATAWDVAVRMASFTRSDVAVLNLSLGCYTDDGAAPLLLARAVELLTPQVVVVAAAGNHGSTTTGGLTPKTPFWPAALDDVVAVGAHDTAGRRAGFSPDTPWVTLTAPGVDVPSTYLNGTVEFPGEGGPNLRNFAGYAAWSGTSFAAATVTGEIAAGTVPGKRAPREALDDLLHRSPGRPEVDVWAYDHRK
jgi:hypothetical protein